MPEQTSKKGTVGLVVDSVCDIPAEILKEYDNIRLVPFHVYFTNENKDYEEGVTITSDEFYEKLLHPELGMPKSQGPNQAAYLQAYQEMLEKYDSIVSLQMSKKMSVAYSSATLARDMLPGADIHIVDTGTVSMALGLFAIQAARMARAGATAREIVEMVERHVRENIVLFMVSTLKYVRASGRVNQVAYLLATFLQVKPILTFKDGMGEPAGRELSEDRALLTITRRIVEKFGDRPVIVSVVHSVAADKAEKLKEMILRKANVKEMIVAELGCIMGVHGGRGIVGATAIACD